ncbi:PBECR4 domain-containing protein [Streptococcus agalactiae]
MAEEHTQQPSSRGKSRRERVEYARSRDILDVASELNMELVRSGRDYRWKEHDSMVISPDKNMWNWFSRHQGGDVISLVETMKEVNFNQAIDYLNDGSFKEYTVVERVQEPFSYYLEPYEQPFEAARTYLKEQRSLSDETIDFFLDKGVLAQANAKVNGSIEPVVVFKSFDFSGEIVGATLQGIEENWEKWPERGYAKNIVRNSDGITGLHVDIGQPNRLIFAESAIDLMSYYELHKDSLQDVRLVSMDGVKEAVVGRHLAQLQSELSGRPLRWSHDQLAEGLQTAIDNNFFTDGKHADWITLAVDNDTGGHNFIDSLREKGATINEDLPDLQPGQDKTDWNDALKQHKILGLSDGMESYQTRSEEQGVLFENLTDVTSTSDHVMEPELQVVFDFSENPKISKQYSSGEVVPYSDFIAKLYEENDWQLISPNSGYDKTYFTLQDEQGSPLISNIRFDIGTEREDLSEQLSQKLPSPYLKLAQKADHDYRAQVSYDTFKANQKGLSEAVQSQIQAGALRITLSDEAYFYTLVNYTGWSHPMQQLKPKAMKGLKEYRAFFESINDTNIDRFKEKGTPEQNQMYDLLKSLQKELGRSNTSTVFSEEVAISAYNLNRRLNSLTAEHWGKGTTDPLGSLGRDTWNIISYPANDIVTDNTDYYDQLVPYHLLEYLNGKNGTVEISPETYETILQQLRDESIIITPEVVEDVTTSPEQVVSSSEETEKPLEVHQGQEVSEQQKNERIYQRKGSLQPEAEGSTSPVLETSTFERSVTSRPTVSSQYLNFSIKDGFKSRKTKYEKSIDAYNLGKLNRRGVDIQEAAQFYLNELANSTIHYFTSDGSLVQVNFLEKNFLHLTGLKIIGDAATPEKVLHDFANGGELSYDDIRLKNTESPFDKIKVLPDLETVLQIDSFYFDYLQDIPRYQGRFDSLIKSDDSDLMLLFRMNTEDGTVPVSVFKARQVLKTELKEARKNEILGIYRERDGVLEQIAVNKEYVKDGGKEFEEILKNKDFDPLQEETIVEKEASTQVVRDSDADRIPDEPSHDLAPSPAEALIDAVTFTKVLDTAYNIGNPAELGVAVPEEFQSSWEQYNQLSEASSGDFKTIIGKADELGLLDKTSAFYQGWQQDRIYNDTYHVRLRGANEGPISPQLPFEPTQLVSYQDFVTELYKANQDVSQTQPIAFAIYAPGGALVKDGVRYAIGDETEPVSRLLGLGYRRLEGYPDLAAIDEEVLSQLENYEVNQDIAAEANEQTVASQETPQERDSREEFQSPKQSIKTGLAQRVEEIMAEDATKILVSSIPQVQENLSVEGDLIGASQPDGQMLYTNQEDFGRDYQLELSVHSPVKIDQLSDIQAPWTLALIQGEQKLGYLAYGSDWGNDFQVKKELEQLASQIGAGNSPEGLYQQEEIDAFLTNNRGQESNYRTKENISSSAEPFDYKTASAHDVSERAFQKIREYTQSPEDLMEYVEFMSKFPQLSPRNVALIQDQWRGANAVATYDQWQSMGEALEIKPEDVIQTKATYVNKRTGETKEVVHQGLSVKSGEKSQITLFRPLMVRMIPVIDESGNHIKNDKGNPKYKKFSDATRQEKELVKEGKLPVRQFQKRDPKTGQPRFTTYKVFELSQTTLKPESYPKAMPNRHYNFNTDKVKTKEVLEGLCDYAESIGVSIMKDEAHVLGNAKGAFFPGEQLILINPDNTPGEKIATTIHELAHATLHNPNLADQYKELPKAQKELEAEMTSHLLSKHFGLDTTEKAIDYMAKWTDNLQGLNDKQLADSLKRIHKTVSKMHKQIEHHTKPYQLGKNRGQGPNFPKAPTKGPSR